MKLIRWAALPTLLASLILTGCQEKSAGPTEPAKLYDVFAVLDTPVDAVPDLSENQVIVFTDWMGRSPREIEDQITYPMSRKLQGLAGITAVRSSSEFNFSMITLIFDDKVDFYFAR